MRGGILIEVASGEAVVRGLCMPHSQRCYRNRVFLLDSGQGHLCVVNVASGKVDTVAALPGYARGLAFHGKYAFVGLSLIRESNIFGGLPITERLEQAQRKCGVYAVDLQSGQVVWPADAGALASHSPLGAPRRELLPVPEVGARYGALTPVAPTPLPWLAAAASTAPGAPGRRSSG